MSFNPDHPTTPTDEDPAAALKTLSCAFCGTDIQVLTEVADRGPFRCDDCRKLDHPDQQPTEGHDG